MSNLDAWTYLAFSICGSDMVPGQIIFLSRYHKVVISIPKNDHKSKVLKKGIQKKSRHDIIQTLNAQNTELVIPKLLVRNLYQT